MFRQIQASLHMGDQAAPATSETLARAMKTNPVVVRRLMAGLREKGLVASAKGHGGGWSLSRPLDAVTLRDIHDALRKPEPLAMGNRTDAPGCLVEQAVNAALGEAFDEAEAFLLGRFGAVTLAQLSANFHARPASRGGLGTLENSHAA